MESFFLSETIKYLYLVSHLTIFKSFKRQPHKMFKHTQTIRQLLLTNCLIVFDHFVGLALRGLTSMLLFIYVMQLSYLIDISLRLER